ncbi:MAG: cobalt-precorrin-5B (C(1))-methyltransferase, partial [Campylobacterales bacterium]
MEKKLKKGYTTGVHTSFAFKSALQIFLATNQLSMSKTNKMDNDDLDITKGCEIIVYISDKKDDLTLNSLPHKPYILKNDISILEIYAGKGVGVVTKDGLKPPKNYPAINPTPLKVMKEIFQKQTISYKKLFCSVS